MAELTSGTASSDELLQQELIALRRRVTQLEQQLATGAVPEELSACPQFPSEPGGAAPAALNLSQHWEENLRQLSTQLERRTIELRQNEARLQTIAASIPGTIFQFNTADKVWKMEYISDRVVDLTGIPASKILQDMSILNQCAHPDDRHRYFHSLLRAVTTGTPWQYEGRITKPDGSTVWFQGEAVPSDHDRTVFYGVILDITDRKLAELALQESQQFIQSIAENSPNLLYLYDLEQQRSLYANREATECLGYSAAEVQALGAEFIATLVHPDDRDRTLRYHDRIRSLADSEAAELEYRLRHRNGEWRWFASRETVFKRDETGAVVQYLGAAQDITDRKQAELELQESRRFLRRVLDTLPHQQIFWKDRNSVYLGCNRLAAKLAGLRSAQDIVGKTDYDLAWTTAEADYFREVDRRVMDSNRTELGAIELRQQTNGQQVWLEISKAPLHDAAGNVTGILVALRDVTERQEALQERKRAEAQLQEQEQFLRSIYDGVDYSIFGIEVLEDNTFRYLGMNAVAERAIGLTSKDYLGKTLDQVLPSELAALNHFRFSACLQAGVSCTWEDHLPFQEEAWWMTTLTPLKDQTGRIHRIIGTSINTTDRKRAEAQLLEQEQFLRSIYDGVACSIFVVDVREDGEFVYNSYNKAAEEFTGCKSAEVTGKTPEERFGPIEGKLIRQGFEHCVQTGTAVVQEEQFTINGREGWFMTTLNPLRNQDGRIYRIVGTAFDVLSLKQAQAQLQQQASDLEAALQELQRTQSQMVQAEKMSSLGQLVAGVAHEINNPVNFIFGNLNHANGYTQDLLRLVELYRKHYPDPIAEIAEEIEAIDLEFLTEDLPKLLSSMKVGADRIQKIVASLRTFSRMDEAEKKQVNIHEGIDSTLMILQNRIKAKPDRSEIRVVKHYGNLPPVECYAGQLNQVFMNLLSNAIDAIEDACPAIPTLTIQTRITRSNKLQISIADNGGGIPQAIRSRLFDPFFTTKPVGKGTGMGLSISYQIVTEKHKGTLKCLSQPGEGATFVITIPLKLSFQSSVLSSLS